MGGRNSGNWYRWSKKSTTGNYYQLRISRMVEMGVIKQGVIASGNWQWTRNGEQVANIGYSVKTLYTDSPHIRLQYTSNGESLDYTVSLTTTRPHYGGVRWWFQCPARGCGRHVAVLYGGKIFACRHCHRLAYPCQQESPPFRLQRRAQKICDALGGECLDSWVRKPKGMHQKTFKRKVAKMRRYEQLSNSAAFSHWGISV